MRSTGRCLLAAFVVALVLTACGKSADGNPGGAGKAWHWAIGLFSAPQEGPKKGKSQEVVPVRIGTVVQQAMPVQLAENGTVEAYSTIEVKAQVSGELVDVSFKEGDTVEKDQILFNIDPRPFQVALKQAEANLAQAEARADESRANLNRNKAEAENARARMKRDEYLLSKGMVSPEEYEGTKTEVEALSAAVQANEAEVRSAVEAARAAKVAIDDAKLKLDYCTIRSPLRGKTGSLLVHQGNLVQANSPTPLVTITQVQPIYVSFSFAEKHLAAIRERMDQEPLRVDAYLRESNDEPVSGTLTFIDNAVRDGGTIRLKATFENKDTRLWPGQFVDAVLQVSVIEKAIVVPSRALQDGQSGPYVYVVQPDLTVELRQVKPGEVHGDLTIVDEGLQPGEKVVTDGQLRLSPGSTISVVDEAES